MDSQTLAKFQRTGHDLARNVITRKGEATSKRRKKVLQSSVAFRILNESENQTIDWQRASPEMETLGFKTIWEYIAYIKPINFDGLRFGHFRWDPGHFRDASTRERFEGIERRARILERGFAQLERILLARCNLFLYKLPRESAEGKSQAIEVITLWPHYQINPEQTAANVAEKHLEKKTYERVLRSRFALELVTHDRVAAHQTVLQLVGKAFANDLPPSQMEMVFGEQNSLEPPASN